MSDFRVLHIVKLAVCRTCVVQPKTEYLGHWAVVHWHSGPMSKMCTGTVAQNTSTVAQCRGAQCPSAQAHGPDTTCAQCPRNVQRQSPTKCTGSVAAPVQDRVWQPLATAPCAGTTLGALWRNCLKMTPNNVTASGYFAHHVRPY